MRKNLAMILCAAGFSASIGLGYLGIKDIQNAKRFLQKEQGLIIENEERYYEEAWKGVGKIFAGAVGYYTSMFSAFKNRKISYDK